MVMNLMPNNPNTSKKVMLLSHASILSTNFLYKDPGEVLYYFSKLYDYEAIGDGFYDNTWDSDMFRTVHLIKYSSSRFWRLKNILTIITQAKKIDILYLLCIQPDSLYKMLAYRLGGGKGKIYLKLDLGPYEKNGKDLLMWKNMPLYLKIAHTIFKPLPDIYTVETQNGYERLKNTFYADLIKKNKLFCMPNGIDPEILTELDIERGRVQEKERIIITVARIGSYQKNSELLLDILGGTDLKDWTMYIVGSIESSFMKKIEEFYQNNPEKRERIIFTGLITQKEKFVLYNRARIFLFTSRHESYAFALAEAAFMHNYIISTNVGIAEELKEISPCFLSNENDKELMIQELQRVILMSDDELNRLVPDCDLQEITWESIIKENEGMKRLAGV